MYSVVVASTKELKSQHVYSRGGLQAANEEALLRTHLTGRAHIVIDTVHGGTVYTALPPDMRRRHSVSNVLLYLAAALMACAVWLSALCIYLKG